MKHFGRNKIKGISKDCKENMEQYKAFIQVRQPILKYKGKSPIYMTLKGKKREELIDMCFELRLVKKQTRQFVMPSPNNHPSNTTNDTNNSSK